MSRLLYLNVGENAAQFYSSSGGAADPQLQFFENFPGRWGRAFRAYSNRTLSVHAVNIPLSLSFNQVAMLLQNSLVTTASDAGRLSVSFGLYSLTGSTLSLANSALFTTATSGTATSWGSFITSATQNITPGAWYFGVLASFGNNSSFSLYGNSSINPANAIPGGFLMGRMTASTAALPGSIATSDLDITGSDAIRQLYIIITA